MRISDWSSDVCSSDLVDRDILGEGADAPVTGASIDRVTGLESSNVRADADDHTGRIMAENEGRLVRQDWFELAAPNLRIEHIQTGGMHFDEDVVFAKNWLGRFANAQGALLATTVENRGFLGLCIDWKNVVLGKRVTVRV